MASLKLVVSKRIIAALFILYLLMSFLLSSFVLYTSSKTDLELSPQFKVIGVFPRHSETSVAVEDFKSQHHHVTQSNSRNKIRAVHTQDWWFQHELKSEEKCVKDEKSLSAVVKVLHNAVLDKTKAQPSNIDRGEHFKYGTNFLQLLCENGTGESLVVVGSTATILVKSVSSKDFSLILPRVGAVFEGHVIAVIRAEFANPFWTIFDVFDIFHIVKDLNITNPQILWLDAHPSTNMDELWSIYFGEPYQFSSFKPSKNNPYLLISNLVIRYDRKKSIFTESGGGSGKAFSQFREHAYRKLSLTVRQSNCDHLRVAIVWRHDYVNHPGNPNGKIDRKISNEKEVLATITSFANVIVTAVCLEQLSVAQQIELMSKTDIFFGMHGAGHGLVVFMPPGGVVIEITTVNHKSNNHLKQIAINANHTHILLVLPKAAKRRDRRSYKVQKSDVLKVTRNAIVQLCPSTAET